LFEERPVTWRKRIYHAVVQLVINLVLWVVIPSLVYSAISGLSSSSPLPVNLTFVYAAGATITGLQVIGALTEGMALSVPFVTGSHLASAYYLYAVVNGGIFAFSAVGVSLSLEFQPLLFLILLPSLFSAVRTPLAYLAEGHEAVRPAPDFA
jgi:hypothetical protein